MKNKHKTLSSLLALSVLMGATPTMVFAEDFIEESDVVTTKEGNVLEATQENLATQLQNAKEGQTVQLTADIQLSETLKISGNKNITLDLNNKKLTLSGGAKALMEVGSAQNNEKIGLKITDSAAVKGVIESSSNASAIAVKANATVVTENVNIKFSDNTSGPNCAFKVEGELTVKAGTNIKSEEGGILVVTTGKVTVKDGAKIDSKFYAISGNGRSDLSNENGTKITIDGGILIASEGSGIYHPQRGELVLNGGTITGLTGVQLCAGKLTVPETSAVKVIATGKDDRANKTGDGNIDDGAAISLINRNYPGKAPKAEIKGGSFRSEHKDAKESILAYNWSNNDKNTEWSEAKNNTDVAGGEFNKPFKADYVADNAPFVQVDGTYYVAKDENALKEIVADAENSVVLLKNVSNVTVPGGVKVENQTGGNVTVNGTTVENGKDINIPTSNGGGSTVKLDPVYRAYNPNNGEHLYTLDEKEYKHVTSIGWQAEDVAFMAEEEKNGQALYRVYNPNSGLHHYTLDENEKNTLVSLGWHDEKVAWYTSKKPQSAPVFRVYNSNDGNHHYTMNKQEKDALVLLGWHDEGIAFRTAPIEK